MATTVIRRLLGVLNSIDWTLEDLTYMALGLSAVGLSFYFAINDH